MKNLIVALCIAALFGACTDDDEPLRFSAWNAQLDSAQFAQKQAEAYWDDAKWVIPRDVSYIVSEDSSVQFTQEEGDSLVIYFLTGGTTSSIPAGETVYEYYPQIMRIVPPPTDATIQSYWKTIYNRLAQLGYCKVFYDADIGKFYFMDNNQKKIVG